MNVKSIKILNLILFLGCILTIFSGCSSPKTTSLNQEPNSRFSLQEYQETINEGDQYFSRMHLYGWYKAENLYKKAFNMNHSEELKEKRLLNLCLIAIREKKEQIVNPKTYESIDSIGDCPGNQKLEYLVEMVRHYRTIPVIYTDGQRIAANEKKDVDVTAFDLNHSPLDTYLFLVCIDYFTYDLSVYNEELNRLLNKYNLLELMKKYAMNPLFIYSNYKAVAERKNEIEQQFPDFAEFMLRKGDRLFTSNRLKDASQYYKKTLTLIPDYTKAINGLGNTYFFTINDYETALSYYQNTLNLDPLNPVALFGKGVSLNFLERFTESDQVLEFMLTHQDQYHGQAYYYRASNQYRLQNLEKARELIDQAKKILQTSGEVHFLSGQLYFQEGKFKEADQDFNFTLFDNDFSPCYPLYYIGLIKLKNNDLAFLRDFSDSVKCFEKRVSGMEENLKSIDTMDIDNHQKEWMKKNRVLQLQSFKEVSGQLIQQMNSFINQNIDKKKSLDQKQIDESKIRVKKLLEMDPGNLNRPLPGNDGGTLLHEATQNNHIEVVQYLLSRGAQKDIKDNNGYTPLHWSVLLGYTDIARLLIDNGADFKQTGFNKMTLLHDAAYNGNTEIVKLLLEKGANLDARDSLGKTPLDLAIEKGFSEIISLLSPLHKAVEAGDLGTFKHLLKTNPLQLNGKDLMGRTPLHVAALKGNFEIASTLIARGANIEARDTDGFTPRELAQKNGHNSIVQLLLDNGASPGNTEILEQNLPEKQAFLWYLGGEGWAIKTQNHFLIFNYHHIEFQLKRFPHSPLLSNGQLNPNELINQSITVFLSYEILESGNRSIFSVFSNFPHPIKYISNAFAKKESQFITLKPHLPQQINGIEITGFNSPGAAYIMGFFIRVDGLTIFYPGTRGFWEPSVWNDFRKEIQLLFQTNINSSTSPGIDIAFLPAPVNFPKSEINQPIIEEFINLTGRLMPKKLILLSPEGSEYLVTPHKEEIEKMLSSHTGIVSPVERGDRFSYRLK